MSDISPMLDPSADPVPPIQTTSAVAMSRVPRASLTRRVGGVLLDWLPVAAVLFGYDVIHNWVGPLLPGAHTFPQIHFDQALFGGAIPTLVLQQAFYSATRPQWWDFAALAVYTTHFVATIIIALALWLRSRDEYRRYITWFVGLTTLGYITYAIYPAVPPWLASQNGALAPTHRIVRDLWEHLGRPDIAALFSGTNVYANDVAAIPSLHAAYPLMLAVYFWRSAGWAMRGALLLYSAAMALALVYTAEHYVVDILIGWAFVAVTAVLMQRLWPAGSRTARLVAFGRRDSDRGRNGTMGDPEGA